MSLRATPVLVTGGTGFIGSHLVRRLVEDGAEVHLLLRPGASQDRIASLRDSLTVWTGTVEDPHAVRECLRGARPQAIFHLAGDTEVRRGGSDPAALGRSIATNLTGTLNVITAAAEAGTRIQRFVRAGGLEEYGRGPVPYAEEQREDPVSPYSASQVAATHYGRMLQAHVGFSILTLRLALVYGPGQSSGFFIPSLIRRCLRGEDFEMTAGEQTRDLLYVSDAVEAFVTAATRDPARDGEIVNVGSGIERRMKDVAEAIVRITGSATRLRFGTAPERASEIERLVCRTDKARALLGWSSRTDLEDGLRRTVDAIRAEGFAGDREVT